MAIITAQNIVDRAEIILQDNTNVRWPSEELLKWLNDGQREVVLHKPDTNPTNDTISLSPGTKQSIPATGLALIEIRRNMEGDAGGTIRAITLIPIQILNEQRPDWHSESQVPEVKHYCFDDRDPKRFYVYPPNDGTGYVEAIYGTAPTDIALGDTISIDDIYANALLDYILYRAYLKDADYTLNDNRAMTAYQSFMQALGIRDSREMRNNPAMQPIILQGAVKSGMEQG